MRRAVPALVIVLALLAAPALASASDASFRRALKPFETRLTADIGYLSGFTVPRRNRVAGVLRRLAEIRGHLAGATRAATRNQGSSRSGRKGRTLVLSALRGATGATGDARACALAVRARHASAARQARLREQRAINAAIRSFEAGGRLLHLF